MDPKARVMNAFSKFTSANTLDSVMLMAVFLAGEVVIMTTFPALSRALLHLAIIVLYLATLRFMLKRTGKQQTGA